MSNRSRRRKHPRLILPTTTPPDSTNIDYDSTKLRGEFGSMESNDLIAEEQITLEESPPRSLPNSQNSQKRGRPKGSRNKAKIDSPPTNSPPTNHRVSVAVGGPIPSSGNDEAPDEELSDAEYKKLVLRESRRRYKQLLTFYVGVGLVAMRVSEPDGAVFLATTPPDNLCNAQRLAKSVADYAEVNDEFASIIDLILHHSALGVMISTHVTVVMAIGANHNLVPKDVVGNVIARVQQRFRVSQPVAQPNAASPALG